MCTGSHTFMDWILGWMSERSNCGASFENVKIFDLDFADDAVNFAETLDILWALKLLMRSQSHWGYGFPGSK